MALYVNTVINGKELRRDNATKSVWVEIIFGKDREVLVVCCGPGESAMNIDRDFTDVG